MSKKTNDGHNLDSDVIFSIRQYLVKNYPIRAKQIKIEYIIEFVNKKTKLLEPVSELEKSHLAKKHPIRTPDIIVVYNNDANKIWFIIEQDGKIHESKKIIKKDKMRNMQYKKANIPLIVLNTKELKSEKKAWYAKLDEEMERIRVKNQ